MTFFRRFPGTGAIVCRAASSFTRFGNFEIFAARNELDVLKTLADYTITKSFPHLGAPCPEVYMHWFREVCKTTADMIVHWMRTGFVHGAMNTDNLSILGLTIDYGPYGWLEDYNPSWTPNTTDARNRRYCIGNQPQIAQWNLAQLANALFPLIKEAKPLQEAVNDFWQDFEHKWQAMMAQKLGLSQFNPETDAKLITDLLELLALVETDFTLFFRSLAKVRIQAYTSGEIDIHTLARPLSGAYYQDSQPQSYHERFTFWLEQYAWRVHQDHLEEDQRSQSMNRINPKYVLRNYLAQEAIDQAEQNNFSLIHELIAVMRTPYDEQPGKDRFAKKRPEWARTRPGCSMLSCSS